MMLGLERMDRMRLFADELTAVAVPRATRSLGAAASGSGSRHHTADAADDEPASQRAGGPQPLGRRVQNAPYSCHMLHPCSRALHSKDPAVHMGH
jgi:hypothetical protein